jgi:hypothetical protein
MSASHLGCEIVCDSPRARRSLRPYAALIRGRERVRSVLEPHLGPMHALERANNIVQALVYEDTATHPVALEMLRHVPRELRCELATAVAHAFAGDVQG